MQFRLPEELRAADLLRERFLSIVRQDHPVAQRKLTLRRFCALQHVVVYPLGGYADSLVSRVLTQRGLDLAVGGGDRRAIRLARRRHRTAEVARGDGVREVGEVVHREAGGQLGPLAGIGSDRVDLGELEPHQVEVALAGVGDGPGQRDLADADGLGGQQDALGVQPVEQVAPALALLAHQPPALDRQVVVGHLARRHGVAPHLGDGPDVDVVGVEVGEEQRQAGEALAAGADEQQHDLALERLGGPDLAAPHDVAAPTLGLGPGGDARDELAAPALAALDEDVGRLRDHRRRQALAGLLREPGGDQISERVLAHDLEHPVPRARQRRLGDDQRTVDQRADHLDRS